MQVIRQVIEENPDTDLPKLITESVTGNLLTQNLDTYFTDIPTFLQIMKENNLYIGGGFVLRNLLKNQPEYKEESWANTDIDFWAVSSSDTHQDPYCPLRKFLKSQGYESRILCSKGRINQLPADYKRLKNFIEQIEEWYKIDYTTRKKTNLLQLMLLKDYNSHVNEMKKDLFFTCNRPFDQSKLNEWILKKGINKYENRTATDFILDAILTFDLTCCQCSFHVDETNPEGLITFYGTLLDYPEQTPIIKNISRYLTKISANIFRTQGLLEWSRTLKRSAKYATRGFTVVNWNDIVDTIIEKYKFNTGQFEQTTQDFLKYWNRFIFNNRFYIFSLNIPIFYIADEDDIFNSLYTFTLRNRRLESKGDTEQSPIDSPLDSLVDERVTKKITYNMVKELTGDVGYMSLIDFKYYETAIPLELNQLPIRPYRFSEEEQIIVNEKKIIEEENKECFDPIMYSDEENKVYLAEDSNNILIVFKRESQTLGIECWSRDSISQVANDPSNVRYKCKETNEFTGRPLPEDLLSVYGFVDNTMEYIKITSKNVFVSKNDYDKLMNSKNKIFYLEEPGLKIKKIVSKHVYDNEMRSRTGGVVQEGYLVSADHCQKGSEMLVYKIKVCGGPDCLELVFGDQGDDNFPRRWLSDENTEYNEYLDEVNEEDDEPYQPITGVIEEAPVRRRLAFEEEGEEEEEKEGEEELPVIAQNLLNTVENYDIGMIINSVTDFENNDGSIDIDDLSIDGSRLSTLALNNTRLNESQILEFFSWLKSRYYNFNYEDIHNNNLIIATHKKYLNVIKWLVETALIDLTDNSLKRAIKIARNDPEILEYLNGVLRESLGERQISIDEEESEEESDEDDSQSRPSIPIQRSVPLRPQPIMIPPRSSRSRDEEKEREEKKEESADRRELYTISQHLLDNVENSDMPTIINFIEDFEEKDDGSININDLSIDVKRLSTLALNNTRLDEFQIIQFFNWLKSKGYDFNYEDRVNSDLNIASLKNYLNVVRWLVETAEIELDERKLKRVIQIARNEQEIVDYLNGVLRELRESSGSPE